MTDPQTAADAAERVQAFVQAPREIGNPCPCECPAEGTDLCRCAMPCPCADPGCAFCDSPPHWMVA